MVSATTSRWSTYRAARRRSQCRSDVFLGAWRSMTERRSTMWWSQCWRTFAFSALVFASLVAPTMPQTPPPAPPTKITIGFVDIDGDPRHEPLKAYERLVLKTREHPFAGAQVGIEEAQAIARVLKIDFALERITVKSVEAVAPALLQAL